MDLKKFVSVWSIVLVVLLEAATRGGGEETAFELPVQLVGFPFIIMAVRLTNFVKKMSYALSPATYRSRNRRFALHQSSDQSSQLDQPDNFDASEVEKYIVNEFGPSACVFQSICGQYAELATKEPRQALDWPEVFSQYQRFPAESRDFYLLSVFLGETVKSPELCRQLGELRSCGEINLNDTQDETNTLA
ncbi:uncharacterized protein LOC105390916 isoform X1 [Plutella xylostella]|uniref:uncharacterized protein LOC105390916 isoform X1 n=1 Tax=Plutella xylostella TaxID=51655 RepID=UPI00203306A2|nr:uncharacterized protein LOC105390916 isoform X1 [Plutella xylostella]